jgi:hypothetical protein
MVINSEDWVLEYIQKPKFKDNEIFIVDAQAIVKVIEEKTDEVDLDYHVGNKVYIEYEGIKSIGKIVRIYNNGKRLNVSWNGYG